MSNKTMLIAGAIIAALLGGYYVYDQKIKPSQEAVASQQPQTPASTDPYSNYNSPSKQ